MNGLERDQFYEDLMLAVERGERSWGEAIRALRVEVAKMNQARFAAITKVSVRTLRDVESGKGNPTLATLQGLLAPFGLRVVLGRKPPKEVPSIK